MAAAPTMVVRRRARERRKAEHVLPKRSAEDGLSGGQAGTPEQENGISDNIQARCSSSWRNLPRCELQAPTRPGAKPALSSGASDMSSSGGQSPV